MSKFINENMNIKNVKANNMLSVDIIYLLVLLIYFQLNLTTFPTEIERWTSIVTWLLDPLNFKFKSFLSCSNLPSVTTSTYFNISIFLLSFINSDHKNPVHMYIGLFTSFFILFTRFNIISKSCWKTSPPSKLTWFTWTSFA